MPRRNKNYTNEFKQEVLRMAETTDKPISELERDLGLSAGLIRKWQARSRVNESGDEVAPSAERAAEAEIRRLKRELEIVRQERDILKS